MYHKHRGRTRAAERVETDSKPEQQKLRQLQHKAKLRAITQARHCPAVDRRIRPTIEIPLHQRPIRLYVCLQYVGFHVSPAPLKEVPNAVRTSVFGNFCM